MTKNGLFPFPGVQLVKCSVIVNGAKEAADWGKERGMGRVSYWSPALSYRASFFKLNVGKTACPRNLVLGRIFPRWMCHWPNLIFFIFIAQVLYELRATIPVPQGRLWGSRTYGTFAYLLHLRVERSGKEDRVNIDKRCVTFCWYACSSAFAEPLLYWEVWKYFYLLWMWYLFFYLWPNFALSGERERRRLIFLISISN